MSSIYYCLQSSLYIRRVYCDLCILEIYLIDISHEERTQTRKKPIYVDSNTRSIVCISINIFTIIHIRRIISEDSMESHSSCIIRELNRINKRLLYFSHKIPLNTLCIYQMLSKGSIIKLSANEVYYVSSRDKRKDLQNKSLIYFIHREIGIADNLIVRLQIDISSLLKVRRSFGFFLLLILGFASFKFHSMNYTKYSRRYYKLIRESHSNSSTYSMSTRGIFIWSLSFFKVSGHMSRGIYFSNMPMGNPSTIIHNTCRLISLIELEPNIIAGRFHFDHFICCILEYLSKTCFPSYITGSTDIHTRKMSYCIGECIIRSKLVYIVLYIGLIRNVFSWFGFLFLCHYKCHSP